MIYFFTGNSLYLVREKTLSWKKAFVEKHGDFNIVHFKNLREVDNNTISQELLSEGFMGKTKLIIIDDFPLTSSDKNKELIEKQEFLESILEKIPQNNIILFSGANIDKRAKFYKKIKKLATKIEEFNEGKDGDIFNIISKKYSGKIDSSAINLLIKYKSGNLEKIISEIEKLLILYDFVKVDYIKNYIFPELEESIFQLVDDIMNENISESINKINIILSQVNVYAFYNNLLANLRILVFIKNLKNSLAPLSRGIISEVLDLKNRSFLVSKNYKISLEKINNLYIGLVNLDKKMKYGKMIESNDEVLKMEIEKEILKIKTYNE